MFFVTGSPVHNNEQDLVNASEWLQNYNPDSPFTKEIYRVLEVNKLKTEGDELETPSFMLRRLKEGVVQLPSIYFLFAKIF